MALSGCDLTDDERSGECPLELLDICNVCEGDGTTCLDCSGVPFGGALVDRCDTCDSDPNNDCVQDCNDVWGGTAVEDNCGICDGDGASCIDCSDSALYDQCSDLEIVSFVYDVSVKDLLVEITNNGPASAIDFEVVFSFDQPLEVSCSSPPFETFINIAHINSGETVTVNSAEVLGISVLEYIAMAGSHMVYVKADGSCAVPERNEENNTAAIEIQIADPTQYSSEGLHGYIGSHSASTPDAYRYGASFYSSVWSLIDEPIASFQVGLPGTWFTPNNLDNTDTPLCPVGTMARDNWPERAPTYQDVFQTMEGGLGYWVGNRFHYGPPKYSMNATPNCYNNQIATPGWPFFSSTSPLVDHLLGIAQLSNRMLISPDGLPFAGRPHGQLVGYGYIALPLTDARAEPQPTGNQNWTLFLSSANFKGPLAYYLPETWSKISYDYPFDHGRGLDARPIRDGLAGSMEINTVPQFQSTDSNGVLYTKIPQLQFPVDEQNKTVLVRDVTFYSKDALFDAVELWKNGGDVPSGAISLESQFQPSVSTFPVTYRQNGLLMSGINEKATPSIFDGNVFGLQWSETGENGFAYFPQYFKQEGNTRAAVDASEVPLETLLHHKEFPKPNNAPTSYEADILNGAWASPGPMADVYEATLQDCSTVIYRWYRFIDQPVFAQYDWSDEDKNKLQMIVEKIHTHWGIDQTYLPAPSAGNLATFDSALIVSPPVGLEVGYVPVVVSQTLSSSEECISQEQLIVRSLNQSDLVGIYTRLPVQNDWHSVSVILDENQLWWQNAAGFQWRMSFVDGVLQTEEDCPYGISTLGIVLEQDNNGGYLSEVKALVFNNETYSIE